MSKEDMTATLLQVQDLAGRLLMQTAEAGRLLDLQSKALCLAIDRLTWIAGNNLNIVDDRVIAKKAIEDIRAMYPVAVFVAQAKSRSVK